MSTVFCPKLLLVMMLWCLPHLALLTKIISMYTFGDDYLNYDYVSM
jgi:hypothetical protein